MRRLRTAAVAVMTALSLTAISASPSRAAETSPFNDWVWHGSVGVKSQTWKTTKTADIWITSVVTPCTVPNIGKVTYTMELWKNKLFDSQVGTTRTIVCSQNSVWRSVAPGEYYFRLRLASAFESKANFKGEGTYYYDGGHP